jgi:hypothetical protein
MAARSDLIISTNPAVGAHRERRIDLGLAQRRSNAAQHLVPARTLRLMPDIHQGLGGVIHQAQPGAQFQVVRHCGIVDRPGVDAATR